jgi:anti-sigma B factor antagonist
MPHKLSLSVHGDAIVLEVGDRLTLEGGSSRDFMNLVEQELHEGHKKIVVDLDNCTYADSSGIAALTSAYIKGRNLGGKVVLANPQKKLRELLQITKLETILATYDSVESALSAVESSVQ